MSCRPPSARAIHGERRAAPRRGDRARTGSRPTRASTIYRHHVLTTLTDVLESTYPVVCRLVDARFFAYAADRYIREHPPPGPCLFEYGGRFPEFLAEFPPCRDLAYLPDVARLEWALHAARHARGRRRRSTRRGSPPCRPTRRRGSRCAWIRRVAYVASPWPIDEIWRANQPGNDGDDPVDLAAGGARLEIRRRGDDVVFRSLDAAHLCLPPALAHGHTLAEAADRGPRPRADFPLAAAVRDLLEDGIAVDLAPTSPPKEV